MSATELIRRLRAAEEPDRSLDWALHTINGLENTGMYGAHPKYTESVDAAIRLLPTEDHLWKCGYSKHVRHNAEVVDAMHPQLGVYVGESDASRAIAICIAAMWARVSMKATDRDQEGGK